MVWLHQRREKYFLHPQIFIVFNFYTNFDHSSYLKNKVMKKSNIYLNYIIFDFFITLIFLIRQIVKVSVKIKGDKYLEMEGVAF
jgi:hypothetical protein